MQRGDVKSEHLAGISPASLIQSCTHHNVSIHASVDPRFLRFDFPSPLTYNPIQPTPNLLEPTLRMVVPHNSALLSSVVRTHRVLSHTRVFSVRQKSQCLASSYSPKTCRYFSLSSRLAYPRKDSQDKDSINPEATEYSKSATDDESARQDEAAFDPSMTDPHEQHAKAGEGRGVSISTFFDYVHERK